MNYLSNLKTINQALTENYEGFLLISHSMYIAQYNDKLQKFSEGVCMVNK